MPIPKGRYAKIRTVITPKKHKHILIGEVKKTKEWEVIEIK
jgi:hypothetical protein